MDQQPIQFLFENIQNCVLNRLPNSQDLWQFIDLGEGYIKHQLALYLEKLDLLYVIRAYDLGGKY